jgi:ABC-type polysaccharide/polyol phosphate transport system ATPase subunit
MTEPETAIDLQDVGKRYWQLQQRAMLLKSLIPFAGVTKTELWALRHLSTTIKTGETVGILGRNGAGKTTLLRLLAGVSQPSEGRIRIRGRIAPLISVGVGFHQEMSGRENVYVNGMLLGLSRGEVAERFDEIVAFAELADFIDTPVKFYSSGMFMRLGFAVAAHVDPDVLLVDEVLAVGDVAFQLKCLDRMRLLQGRGTTIVLVSHSMHAIRLLCPRTLLIRKGQLEFDGSTEKAISRHHELLSLDSNERLGLGDTGTALGTGVAILSRQLVGPHGPTNHPDQGDVVTYRVRLRFDRQVESPQIYFQVVTEVGTLAYGMQTPIGQEWQIFKEGETTEVEVSFRPHLGGGTYRLMTIVTDRDGRDVLYTDPNGLLMYMAPQLGSTGFADLDARIVVDGQHVSQYDDLLLSAEATPDPLYE